MRTTVEVRACRADVSTIPIIDAIVLYSMCEPCSAAAQADRIMRGETVIFECLDCNAAAALATRLEEAGFICNQ